ncbi:hypothetical protein JI435_072290, partial [Parastagonospora nodorum SN15]
LEFRISSVSIGQMAAPIAARMEDYHEFLDQVHGRQCRVTTFDRHGTDLVYPTIEQHLTISQSTTYMPYVYSPLELPDQIRLLRIHPGEPEDPIETSLVTASLDVSPDYDALSYVWGSHADRCQIWVDGLTVLVPLGGFQALHSLRRSRCERPIWIDAFSINQEDLNDKSHQVRLMCDIYQGARSVVVYLGNATDKTGDAMRALQYLIQARTETAEPPWMHTELIDVEDVLQDILDRPWFKRIWTVQEATLARHTILVCGEHRLSWYGNLQSLRRIAFRIKSTAISPYFSVASGRKSKLDWSSLLDIVETQMRQAARREGAVIHRNQLDLAFQFRYRQSADPRDNYFALFGIVENENGGRLEFKPDYSISLKELHLRYMEEIQRISEIEDAPPSPTPTYSQVWVWS